MKNETKGAWISILLVALVALTGCELEPPKPVKIGVILPLTGDFAIYGTAGLRGAEMAVSEINRTGGVLGGRPLELVVADNQTDPSESIRQTRRLIQTEQVLALVGPVSSAARNAVVEQARKFRVPLLYGIDYEGESYDRYLFCYSTIPDHYITPIIPSLVNESARSVYILGYDYVWPHELSKAVEQEVPGYGGEVVGKEFVQFGLGDYSKTLKRIEESGAQVLVLILPGNDGFELIRQFNEAGLQGRMRILAIASDESYLQELAAKELEGIYTGLHFFASLDTDKARSFVSRFKAMYGSELVPTYATESHYGLIRLLATAINEVGELDREKIIDAMEHTDFESGGGTVRGREDHHFDLPMFLAEFTRGELVVRKSLGVISPRDQRP